MFRRTFITIAAAAALPLAAAFAFAQTDPGAAAQPSGATSVASAAPQSGYAPVNGLNLYYEIHGTGRPLILLHGGIGTIEMFGEVLPLLAEGRQVIAVDLQAHGHTADIDRPMTFEAMADDIAGLIAYLGLGKADIMGYSLGGGVGLRTAIQHPDVVNKLVLVSTPFRQSGWYPEVLAGQAQVGPGAVEPLKQTPLYQFYVNVAPRPEDFPVLLTKLGDLLRRNYDWSAEVAAVTAPTMIVAGDADAVITSHAVEFFGLLGGGQRDGGFDGSGMSNARLAILPGLTHYAIFSAPVLASTVAPFLDAPAPQPR